MDRGVPRRERDGADQARHDQPGNLPPRSRSENVETDAEREIGDRLRSFQQSGERQHETDRQPAAEADRSPLVAAPPQEESEEQQDGERKIRGDHHGAGQEQGDAEQSRRNAGGDFSQQGIDQQAAEQEEQHDRQARRDLAHAAEGCADRGDDP
jgi:hypothetical protein